MADSPSSMPYIWASTILFLLGVILTGLVLYLRPAIDPLLVITPVFGFVISIGAAIAAFLKSQETHLTVNSQLSAWKLEFEKLKHAEGMLDGMAGEQARIAEQKRVAVLSAAVPSVLTAPVAPVPAPVPVIVQNPEPLPVVVAEPVPGTNVPPK